MGWIDQLLENRTGVSGEDFVQRMADIYMEAAKDPIGLDHLDQYPRFVQDVALIIDFDTELQMEGILGFLENSTGCRIEETILALRHCGAQVDADLMEKIHRSKDEDEIERLADQLYLNDDPRFDEFWSLVFGYADRELRK